MDFKVGDKIRYVGSGEYWKDYENVVVEGVAGGPGSGMPLRVWVSFNRFGKRDTIAIFLSKIDQWEKVPETFQVGKTYKAKSGNGATITILDIYEVDSPATEGDRVTAVGRATAQEGGGQYITPLGNWEFKYYEEV